MCLYDYEAKRLIQRNPRKGIGMNIDKTYLGCFGKAKHSLRQPRCIVIHHTCTSSAKRTREVLKKKGYSTHFEVEKDGTIYQYRECTEQCDHAGSVNWQAIGIDITHAENAPWPEAQIAAARKLVQWLCARYDIPLEVHDTLPGGIYPHKAIGQTACPQDFPMHALTDTLL